MLQEIKDLQKNKIAEVINVLNRQNFVTFKAPTGSGKTHMMMDFMNRVIQNNQNIIFIVSSLSTSGLAKQNYDVFIKNNKDYKYLKPFYIDSDVTEQQREPNIDTDCNVYVLPTDKFKKRSLLKERGTFINFLNEIRRKNQQIYLIKDESHRETKNLNSVSEYFTKTLNFSATPKTKADVEIDDRTAINTRLIKNIIKKHETLSDYGINEFLNLQKKYKKLIPKLNPCLIIQISNKSKGAKEWEKIEKILQEVPTLQYVLISGNSKDNLTNSKILQNIPKDKWKDELKQPLCPVSIIVFKLVIKEGYDIPRACMLYQVRDTESGTLDEQVLGRIRRNPILVDWEDYDELSQELALEAYAWGDFKIDDRTRENVTLKTDNQFSVKFKTTTINNLWKQNKISFDLDKILDGCKISELSIFALHNNWNKLDDESKKIIKNQISDDKKWFLTSSNIDIIKEKNNEYIENYDNSIELSSDCGFLKKSAFWNVPNTNYVIYSKQWVWIKDNKTDAEFWFDSPTEKIFVRDMLNIILQEEDEKSFKFFGKNHYFNEKEKAIKYGYVYEGPKLTYPDFIVKKDNNIFIIEVKNLHESNQINMGESGNEKYKEKINNLITSYQYTSKKIPYYFCIVLCEPNGWILHRFFNGVKKVYEVEANPLSELFVM